MTRRIMRVNSLIRQELSELLQRQAKDPRLGNFIAVTEVSASADLKYAKVFVSHLGSDEEKKETLNVLNTASGYFRRELGQRLKLRYIPVLNFCWDASLEQGSNLLQLIEEVAPEETP